MSAGFAETREDVWRDLTLVKQKFAVRHILRTLRAMIILAPHAPLLQDEVAFDYSH